MWIDPADSNHILAGSDGGIHWSYDAGRTWDFVNTIAIGQFYEIGLDNESPITFAADCRTTEAGAGRASR